MASRFVLFNGRKYNLANGLSAIQSNFVSVYKGASQIEFYLIYKQQSDFESGSAAMIARLKADGVIVFGENTVYPAQITCGSPSYRIIESKYEWYNDPEYRRYHWFKMNVWNLVPGCFEGQYFPGGSLIADLFVDYYRKLFATDSKLIGISDENYQPTIFGGLRTFDWIIDTTPDEPEKPDDPPYIPPDEPDNPPYIPPDEPDEPVNPVTEESTGGGLISLSILLIIGGLIYLIVK